VILLDTSVLVRYLRTASPAIRQVLVSTDCVICGVTRAEILHGARTPADVKDLHNALDSFLQLPIQEATWDHLGLHLATLRSRGLPMPFQDVLLATVARYNNKERWS
jgi:predicted nucleic acid-binding protein